MAAEPPARTLRHRKAFTPPDIHSRKLVRFYSSGHLDPLRSIFCSLHLGLADAQRRSTSRCERRRKMKVQGKGRRYVSTAGTPISSIKTKFYIRTRYQLNVEYNFAEKQEVQLDISVISLCPELFLVETSVIIISETGTSSDKGRTRKKETQLLSTLGLFVHFFVLGSSSSVFSRVLSFKIGCLE